MNKVILIGNVSRTPKTYLTHHGKEYTTFFVETTDSWRDETGEWHSATDRHRVSVFRESSVRWIKDVLKRGDRVSVEGKLTYEYWTDKFGQSRFTPHVVIARTEGKVEHFLCDSMKNGKSSSNLNSTLKIESLNSELNSETTSEQEVIASNSEENEDPSFELLEEQIHPKQ
ncbi:MAG: single-stranded DNA-binding protein [Alphaproteobacteria bacterium]|nr:single-stranded DNA-binding protein [Alphaproteobacteria bacterium]